MGVSRWPAISHVVIGMVCGAWGRPEAGPRVSACFRECLGFWGGAGCPCPGQRAISRFMSSSPFIAAVPSVPLVTHPLAHCVTGPSPVSTDRPPLASSLVCRQAPGAARALPRSGHAHRHGCGIAGVAQRRSAAGAEREPQPPPRLHGVMDALGLAKGVGAPCCASHCTSCALRIATPTAGLQHTCG